MAEQKLGELLSAMAGLGKEAASAMTSVEAQQQRVTLQRLISMVGVMKSTVSALRIEYRITCWLDFSFMKMDVRIMTFKGQLINLIEKLGRNSQFCCRLPLSMMYSLFHNVLKNTFLSNSTETRDPSITGMSMLLYEYQSAENVVKLVVCRNLFTLET